MNKSTIVQVTKGHVPDRSVIEAVTKAYPTVFGHACQYEGEIEHEVTDKPWPVDDIIKLLTDTKDEGNRLLFFGHWEKFEDETDIGPYVISPDEGGPILAYAVEGAFEDLVGLNGKHVGEYNLAAEVLSDIFEKFTGEDEDKFLTGLKSDKCKTLVHNAIKTRGWLTFLPKTGDAWSIGKNDQMLGFPWGSISNKEGIELPKAETAEPAKKKFGLSFLKKKAEEPTPAPDPEIKPVKDPAPVEPVKEPAPIHNPKQDTAVVWRKVQVPPQLVGGVRNAWIRLFSGDRAIGLVGGDGDLPGDHLSKSCHVSVHPSLVPFTEIKVTDTKSMKELREKVLKGIKPETPPKDMKESKSTVREAYVPSDNQWDTALEKYVKFLDASGKKRPSPIEIQKSESKRTVFSQKLGIDFNEMFLRTPEEISELFDGNEIATDAYIEMRRYAIEKSGLKLEDLVAASAKADEAKAEVNTEAVNDKPAKKTGGGLSFLKKNKDKAA